MIDLAALHLVMRNRALGAVIATTGSTSLSATATGYHRAAGSFVTEKFAVGMELVSTGFATNVTRVITEVTASDLKTTPVPTAEAEASGRTLLVGFPALRAFENVIFQPTSGRPYASEEFVPATSELVTGPAPAGQVEERGMYVITLYGLTTIGPNQGAGISALRRSAEAVRALFAPGTQLAVGSDKLRIPGKPTSTQTGQIIPLTSGFAALAVKIPWVARSQNAIAA